MQFSICESRATFSYPPCQANEHEENHMNDTSSDGHFPYHPFKGVMMQSCWCRSHQSYLSSFLPDIIDRCLTNEVAIDQLQRSVFTEIVDMVS